MGSFTYGTPHYCCGWGDDYTYHPIEQYIEQDNANMTFDQDTTMSSADIPEDTTMSSADIPEDTIMSADMSEEISEDINMSPQSPSDDYMDLMYICMNVDGMS